ncbi:MAG: DUF4386 domain-containing protein [Chitinophagales bacterium]
MSPSKKMARIAGALYLLAILAGVFSLRYVPSKIIVWDNPDKTFRNIIEQEKLFRLGIIAGIFGYTAFFILPMVLYSLLHVVNKSLAIGMLALAVVSIPFSIGNLLYKVNVLTMIEKKAWLKPMDSDLPAQVLLNLHFYNNGILIASVFWGLWLFPFGLLVFRSGFLPKMLGVLLMAGCFAYLINFLGEFLSPQYSAMDISKWVTLPASLGELGICLWLLSVGVKPSPDKTSLKL